MKPVNFGECTPSRFLNASQLHSSRFFNRAMIFFQVLRLLDRRGSSCAVFAHFAGRGHRLKIAQIAQLDVVFAFVALLA